MELPSWLPTTDDVATYIPARTNDTFDNETGAFTANTRPTVTQVTAIIAQVAKRLVPRLGEVTDEMEDQAAALVALKTACQIEVGFFPEQVNEPMSPYAALMADYNQALKDWDKVATGDEPNGVHYTSIVVGTLYPGYATFTE